MTHNNAPELKKSVLVIEDHAESCAVLKQMLRRRGLHAECAESMKEGISCLDVAERQGRPYSCVVSDLVLDDSNALQTVEALKLLRQRSKIPIRAISGVQEPSVIEACRMAGIPLILKGTSAEGIMESVLYAIAEQQPDHEIYEMIADNRAASREVKAGLFQNWSATGKIFATAGVIISTLLGALTLGGFLYHRLEDTILKRKEADSHFGLIDDRLKLHDEQIAGNADRIRKREDDAIHVSEKIDALSTKLDTNKADFTAQLNRIEMKVDRK